MHIMDCLETEISKKYDVAVLDVSLPSMFLYENRGYKTVGHRIYELENDVKSVYEVMNKKLVGFNVYERRYKMKCKIRKWELLDAKDLAIALSNRKIQYNF